MVSEPGWSKEEEDPRRSEVGKVKSSVLDKCGIKIATSLDRESQIDCDKVTEDKETYRNQDGSNAREI